MRRVRRSAGSEPSPRVPDRPGRDHHAENAAHQAWLADLARTVDADAARPLVTA
jgi:hypothetical protein